MIDRPQEQGFASAAEGAFRTARILATALLAGLLVDLAVEEGIRIGLRPFYGLAHLGTGRTAARVIFYLSAASTVVTIRLVHGFLRRPQPALPPELRLRRLSTATVVALVMAEIPALLGLGLFLLGGYNIDFYMMLFASLVLLFMYFPRRPAWAACLREGGPACPF